MTDRSPLSTSAGGAPVDANAPGSGSALVAQVVETELKAEETRKASIEARGGSVITTSGGLVTVLFALAAVVTNEGQSVPDLALGAVLLSLFLFVGAAVFGLLTSAVKNYERIKVEDVESTVKNDWLTITSSQAQSLIAKNNLAVLKSARGNTTEKAGLLDKAIALEVAAVAVLAVAVAIILIDAF